MNEALKFTDLDAFLEAVKEMGLNGEVTNLIYERGKLPYCTAYFVPTNLLPSAFDLTAINQFGGTFAQVKQINYVGPEDFDTDFMIFPLSRVGYIQVESTSPAKLVPGKTLIDWTKGEMVYVINVEDGGGKEFYLTASGNLVGLTDQGQEDPQTFKTHKQVNKQLELLRQKYPATCQVYAVDHREFEVRRKTLIEHPDQ